MTWAARARPPASQGSSQTKFRRPHPAAAVTGRGAHVPSPSEGQLSSVQPAGPQPRQRGPRPRGPGLPPGPRHRRCGAWRRALLLVAWRIPKLRASRPAPQPVGVTGSGRGAGARPGQDAELGEPGGVGSTGFQALRRPCHLVRLKDAGGLLWLLSCFVFKSWAFIFPAGARHCPLKRSSSQSGPVGCAVPVFRRPGRAPHRWGPCGGLVRGRRGGGSPRSSACALPSLGHG